MDKTNDRTDYIEITLKSDLCAASGQGFTDEIDTDVSYDRNGVPYIGARRLKGCLRRAAEYIGNKNIDALFGVSGSHESGALKLSNAVPTGYEETPGVKSDARRRRVIDIFTYTKAQTEIKDDLARENSLRFTRVVKHYSPVTGRETEFLAECECGEYAGDMKDICRALRNIGFMRSRGLGAVKCAYIRGEIQTEISEQKKQYDSAKKYRIGYTVKLTDSLMISSDSDMESQTYISGTAVLGALAASYLKTRETDRLFDELFLNGGVIYSNLYVSDENNNVTVPAPMFLGKIKSSDPDSDGKIISLFDEMAQNTTFKPLKHCYTDRDFNVKDVLTETIYHNSRVNSTLYTQNCISSGQYFSGSVICGGDYVNVIINLLNAGMRLGKSKTAQYSKCKIYRISADEYKNESVVVGAGQPVILAPESDLILTDEPFELMREKIGISSDCLTDKTILQYKTINGYNAKWNLRKISQNAVAGGSVIVYIAPKEMTLDKYMYVGEKTHEGFGKIRVYTPDDIKLPNAKEQVEAQTRNPFIRKINELIEADDRREAVRLEAVRYAEAHKDKFTDKNLNAAFCGRIMLMLDEANSFENLLERVNSIKSKEKRSLVLQLTENTDRDWWREYLKIVFTLGKYQLRSDKGAEK